MRGKKLVYVQMSMRCVSTFLFSNGQILDCAREREKRRPFVAVRKVVVDSTTTTTTTNLLIERRRSPVGGDSINPFAFVASFQHIVVCSDDSRRPSHEICSPVCEVRILDCRFRVVGWVTKFHPRGETTSGDQESIWMYLKNMTEDHEGRGQTNPTSIL